MAKGEKKSQDGFVGIYLTGKDGDMTLFNRLEAEVKRTTLNRSQILRMALIEYLDKKDQDDG